MSHEIRGFHDQFPRWKEFHLSSPTQNMWLAFLVDRPESVQHHYSVTRIYAAAYMYGRFRIWDVDLAEHLEILASEQSTMSISLLNNLQAHCRSATFYTLDNLGRGDERKRIISALIPE